MKKILFVLSAMWIGLFSTLYAQSVVNQQNIPANNQTSPPVVTYFPRLFNLSPVTKRNFVRTYDVQMPVQDANLVQLNSTFPQLRGGISTKYFDGLGRPMQDVVMYGADGFKDLTVVHTYDNMGRKEYQYLPFSTMGANEQGKLKVQALNNLSAQYTSLYQGEQPYAKTVYDYSPLSKIVETQAPGKSWTGQGTTGRGVKIIERSNTLDDAVPYWGIDYSGMPNRGNVIPAGQLLVTGQVDEDENIKIEFKDLYGKLICSRNALVASPSQIFSANEWATLYHVYDDLDRLTYIITPEASKLNLITIGIRNELCYHYLYDKHNRIIEKKLPGKEAEYFVYDAKDRMVFYQDGNMRATSPVRWRATIYDVKDRELAKAVYASNQTAGQLSELVNNNTPYTSYPSNTLMYHLKNYNAIRNGFSSTQQLTDATLIECSYYDDYDYPDFNVVQYDASLEGYFSNSLTVPATYITRNTGSLLTCKQTRVQLPDGGWGVWLWNTYYYDHGHKLIQAQAKNLNGGVNVYQNQYDFSGTLVNTVNSIINPFSISNNTIISTRYLKDHLSLKAKGISQKINGGNWRMISSLQYDELGRLKEKRYASDQGGGFRDIYTYNIQNWITGINPDFVDNNSATIGGYGPFFGEKIFYNEGFASRLYNGNIAGIIWKGGSPYGGLQKQFYGYTYDRLNRLTHAEYGIRDSANLNWQQYNSGQPSTTNFSVSNINYDHNGNLLTMNQNGPIADPTALRPVNFGPMDQLSYHYLSSSNKLDFVSDAIASSANLYSTPDFRDSGAVSGNYHYDPNGNMDQDHNKNVYRKSIYSYQNKPLSIYVDSNKITWIVDATGTVLQKKVTTSGGIVTTYDYMGDCIFKNDTLQTIAHAEGVAKPMAGQTDCRYDFYIKDHLNNVRAIANTSSVLYYPPRNDDDPDTGPPIIVDPVSPLTGPLTYTAGLEVASANLESMLWDNLNNVRDPRPEDWTMENAWSARLDGSDPDRQIGTAIMLKVMPGDHFSLSAESFYEANNENYEPELNGEQLAATLLETLAGGNVASNGDGEISESMEILNNAFGTGGFASIIDELHQSNYDPSKPASFLNYIVLDESMNVISAASGMKQADGADGWKLTSVDGGIQIDQSGYLVVFTSNLASKAVFWDMINMTQFKGTVAEVNHYYPFGLTLSSSLPGVNENNKIKLTSKELQDEFGLNLYNFGARLQDMQIGRWHAVDPKAETFNYESPYAYVGNNPITYLDSKGEFKYKVNDDIKAYLNYNDESFSRFHTVLKNAKQFLLDNPVLISVLHKTTGLAESEILEMATYGKGPTFRIGEYAPFTESNRNAFLDNSINVRYQDADALQKVDGSNRTSLAAYTFSMFTFIFHEFAHFGDRKTNGSYNSGQALTNPGDLAVGIQKWGKSKTGHRGNDISDLLYYGAYIRHTDGEKDYQRGEDVKDRHGNLTEQAFKAILKSPNFRDDEILLIYE